MWLFELMYHRHAVRSLRRRVNHLRSCVGELVGFHHSHLGPVGEIHTVLKQADGKRVRDHSTSMDNGFSIKECQDNDLLKQYCIQSLFHRLLRS